MSAPTRAERAHYAKLVGRTVLRIRWQEMEGQALPVVVLDGHGRDGEPAHFLVLADPEGNGVGHLDHNL